MDWARGYKERGQKVDAGRVGEEVKKILFVGRVGGEKMLFPPLQEKVDK